MLAATPYLVIAAVATARAVLGPGAGLLPLLAIGPAIAAAAAGWRHTVAVGVVALCLGALVAALAPPTGRSEIVAFASVVGVTAASTATSILRHRRDMEIAEVESVAHVAQRVLLHGVPPRAGPLALAVRYNSAAARAYIGGDLYEVLPTRWGLRLVVGDVQGRGLTAVQSAAVVLGAFREAAHDEPALPRVAERLESSLGRQIGDEQFVTAVLAEIPADGARMTVVNCGHPPPLHMCPGSTRPIGPADGNVPLGLSSLAGLPRRSATTTVISPGEEVLFYTDGVSEARNVAGEFFPLAAAARARPELSADEELAELERQVRRHVGRQLADDAAMLLVRRLPVGAGDPPAISGAIGAGRPASAG